MGFREVTIVFDNVQGVSTGEKLLLVALADRTFQDGACITTVAELEERTGQSRRTIFRQLKKLRENGMVTWEKQFSRDALTGERRQAPSKYFLALAAMERGDFAAKSSGCQNDTLSHKRRSEPGCQNDTLSSSGCQTGVSQGVTGGTPNKINQDITPPPPTEHSGGRASRLDGANAPGEGDNSNSTDTAILDKCLPSAMRQGLSPRHREQLTNMVRSRVSAGWSEKGIHDVLNSREMPSNVHSLFAFVRARLERDVPPDKPIASREAPSDPHNSPSYHLADGTVIPGTAIVWGDVTLEWQAAIAAGTCSKDTSKQSWLSGIPCDRFVNDLFWRRSSSLYRRCL